MTSSIVTLNVISIDTADDISLQQMTKKRKSIHLPLNYQYLYKSSQDKCLNRKSWKIYPYSSAAISEC